MRLVKESWAYRAARSIYRPVREFFRRLKRAAAMWLARRTIRRYLLSPGFKGLQIGCGPHRLESWLNSDLLTNKIRDLFIDITEPLPIGDGSLDAVYASEVIEHVPESDARSFWPKAHRALKPGGVLRLTTPDLAAICGLYLGMNPAATIDQFGTIWKGGVYTPERWVNAQFRAHGHQFIWSFESLTSALREAGFEIVFQCPPRITFSGRPQMNQLERHYSAQEPTWVYARTLIVEAIKSPQQQTAAIEPRETNAQEKRDAYGHLERGRPSIAPTMIGEVAMFI